MRMQIHAHEANLDRRDETMVYHYSLNHAKDPFFGAQGVYAAFVLHLSNDRSWRSVLPGPCKQDMYMLAAR